VWTGAAAAFTVHMAIAVTAGQLISFAAAAPGGRHRGRAVPGRRRLLVDNELPPAAPQRGRRGAPGQPASVIPADRRDQLRCRLLGRMGRHYPRSPRPNLAARSNPVAVFAGSTLALWLNRSPGRHPGCQEPGSHPHGVGPSHHRDILLVLGIYTALTALHRLGQQDRTCRRRDNDLRNSRHMSWWACPAQVQVVGVSRFRRCQANHSRSMIIRSTYSTAETVG